MAEMRETIKTKKRSTEEAPTVASLAPSFPAFFDCHPLQLVTALKCIGFDYVEETVCILPEVLELRRNALAHAATSLIGESCPRVRQLIVEEFPDLQHNIALIPSPMELHGKHCRSRYGPTAQIVFLSPCKHKRIENDQKQVMDDVWLFDELRRKFDAAIDQPLNQLKQTEFDSVLAQKHVRLGVLSMTVHGPDSVRRYFQQHFTNTCAPAYIEALYCSGGCAGEHCQFSKETIVESGEQSSATRLINIWEDY